MGHLLQRASRSPRWIDARVRSKRQPEFSAVISNISETGCCIESAVTFEIGELVEILVPRLGSIVAAVKWSDSGHSGAAFIAGSDEWLIPDSEAAAYRAKLTQEANSQYGG
jgi:hypothetical protein